MLLHPKFNIHFPCGTYHNFSVNIMCSDVHSVISLCDSEHWLYVGYSILNLHWVLLDSWISLKHLDYHPWSSTNSFTDLLPQITPPRSYSISSFLTVRSLLNICTFFNQLLTHSSWLTTQATNFYSIPAIQDSEIYLVGPSLTTQPGPS